MSHAVICLLVYFAAISLFAVAITVRDKKAARNNAWRVKERTLLVVAFLGGSVAMFLAMIAIRHKTSRIKFVVGIPLMIIVQIAVVASAFNQNLSVSRFRVETDKIGGQIKLVLVSDLHSCNYGNGQRILLDAIEAEQPDAILLCGDIFDDRIPADKTVEFIEGISTKYPCYYVSGNHEFWSGKADEFKHTLESYGVNVLEGTSFNLDVRGDRIIVCGIDDPDTDRYASRSVLYIRQLELLGESADYELFTVLLSHRPERIEELLPLNPDLVLSGHAHGGQWRIPLVLKNGLLSPDQGFFPKYTNGEYFFEGAKLIVSRGLARETTSVPRIFNRPELVIVTLEGTQ